jgi:hypothetical protein
MRIHIKTYYFFCDSALGLSHNPGTGCCTVKVLAGKFFAIKKTIHFMIEN